MMLHSVAAAGYDSKLDDPPREPALDRVERSIRPAVLQAITSIRDRYFESITLADLASEVFISRFHFSRMFADATGVTPGRFLTAVRLFEAKRLLLTTSLNVSDIVCSVGYSSVGTFTSRFSRAVGMTPTQYREPQVAELLVAISPTLQRIPRCGSCARPAATALRCSRALVSCRCSSTCRARRRRTPWSGSSPTRCPSAARSPSAAWPA